MKLARVKGKALRGRVVLFASGLVLETYLPRRSRHSSMTRGHSPMRSASDRRSRAIAVAAAIEPCLKQCVVLW